MAYLTASRAVWRSESDFAHLSLWIFFFGSLKRNSFSSFFVEGHPFLWVIFFYVFSNPNHVIGPSYWLWAEHSQISLPLVGVMNLPIKVINLSHRVLKTFFVVPNSSCHGLWSNSGVEKYEKIVQTLFLLLQFFPFQPSFSSLEAELVVFSFLWPLWTSRDRPYCSL